NKKLITKQILQIFETTDNKKLQQLNDALFLDILSNKITKKVLEKYGLGTAYYMYFKNIDEKDLGNIIYSINICMYEDALKEQEELREKRKDARGNKRNKKNVI
uniref:hypothetical protein n=1 Tax=Candidatus Phytoplasma sp. AldY-WA1 TaxID=2852100 RepID=UPI00254C9F5E